MEAHAVALECRHDQAAAEAATLVSAFIGDRTGRFDEAWEWLRVSRAMIARIGGNPLLDAWATVSECAILYQSGKAEAAVAACRRALAAKEKLLGTDQVDTILSVQNLAAVLGAAGHHDEALAAHGRAQADFTRLLGPEHPRLAMNLSNEGELLNNMRRHPEARRAFQQAIDIWRRAGVDPFLVAYALTGLGLAYLGEQRPGDAVAPLEEALRIRTEKHVDAEHMGEVRFALARALWPRPGPRARARALAAQAREDYRNLPRTSAAAATALAAIDAWTSQR
jgi:tetratricopeptide (TPR) repeat protein